MMERRTDARRRPIGELRRSVVSPATQQPHPVDVADAALHGIMRVDFKQSSYSRKLACSQVSVRPFSALFDITTAALFDIIWVRRSLLDVTLV